MATLPRFVILGRPNVGKSTLFNRICGRRRALVGNEPGMTRDRLYGRAEWQGKSFEVVDTGGIVPADRELMAEEILRQARMAIDESAGLVLLADGRAGAVPLDEELAHLLRATGKPLALAVNKIDSVQHFPLLADFHRLGISEIFPISAEHGLGVDDLLDYLVGLPAATKLTAAVASSSDRKQQISDMSESVAGRPERSETGTQIPAPQGPEFAPPPTSDQTDTDLAAEHARATPGTTPVSAINVAIIGRPNVGKSTLLNRLLKEERSIVTPVAGTTRDAVDAELEYHGIYFRLVDTAGIRRKGKTKLLAEKLSVIQARKHLERSDVALVLLDATEGVTALDTHIAGYAHESRRSVVLVVNKWDAVKKGPGTTEEFTESLRTRMKYLDYAPIIFVSAQTGQRLEKLLGVVVQVATARQLRIGTAEMNRFVRELDLDRLPLPRHKPMRLYYLTQAGVAPPIFIAFTNRAGKLHFSVERFLENRIRERFGFAGTPIVIKSRQSR
jgi:GTP-binding protein